MRFAQLVTAELRKTATLPAALIALAIAIVGPVGVTALNAFSIRGAVRSGRADLVAYTTPVEAVFSAVPLGTVGAVILGVIAVSSEYTGNRRDAGGGRQITATLTATPGRLRVLAAKAIVVVLLISAVGAVTIPGSLALATAILQGGETDPPALGAVASRAFGAIIYWALTALIALAITIGTRNGIVPLIVLVVNSSLVSFSFLLLLVTPVARYLPDLAGSSLFAGDLSAADDPLSPLVGGLVMATWTAGLLVAAGVLFARRDA